MTGGKRAAREPAEELPVARVCVDVPLPHLDRLFDYLVPAADAEAARPGVRVRVRFAGQLVDGWLLDRVAASDHTGKLSYLSRVVSAEPVLRPDVLRLARAVAARYAGSLSDVLRLAVPPRHARVEAEPPAPVKPQTPAVLAAPDEVQAPVETAAPVVLGAPVEVAGAVARAAPAVPVIPAGTAGSGWSAYAAGDAYLRALAEGRAPRAVWTAAPGEDWPARFAEAAAATVAGGRGVVAVVADARDLDRVAAALTALSVTHVALSAALGPAERYRRFLRASRGQVPVVVGTRAAALAPVGSAPAPAVPAPAALASVGSTPAPAGPAPAELAPVGPVEESGDGDAAGPAGGPGGEDGSGPARVAELGLVAIWDDGDDLHAEPRSPYPHAREVLLLRAHLTGAAALVGGYTRTAEGQQLVETGWAKPIAVDRTTLRARAPRVTPTGDDPALARDPAAAAARLPSDAWRAARDALAAGAPVLVQVPRRGYLPAVACGQCRTPARCAHCAGPLELRSAQSVAACRWCGRPAAGYTCPECGGRRLRAAVTGARRTAEELGRAFPGQPVRTSGGDSVLAEVPAKPAVVVATPGAEPVADGGYGAVLLLDTWALLTRAGLRAGEEALRRWLAAAALARPAAAGGRVVVVADGGLPAVQALLRFDPAWYAGRELAERRTLGFPPAARVATVTGAPDAVADLLAAATLPAGTDVLGPVPDGDGRPAGDGEGPRERMLLRVARGGGPALAAALHAAAGVRSARKAREPVRIQVDPLDLL